MATITFIPARYPYFKITVKEEFSKVYPDFISEDLYTLLCKYRLNEFLHNIEGPAVVNTEFGLREEFWVDGYRINNCKLKEIV